MGVALVTWPISKFWDSLNYPRGMGIIMNGDTTLAAPRQCHAVVNRPETFSKRHRWALQRYQLHCTSLPFPVVSSRQRHADHISVDSRGKWSRLLISNQTYGNNQSINQSINQVVTWTNQPTNQGIIYTPLLGVVHPPIDVNTPPNCAPPLGVCVLF